MQPLLNCLKDIKTWMDLNFINLNKNKTEIIMFGRPYLLDTSDGALGPLVFYNQSFVTNLGVTGLSLPSFFERVIHDFITSWLDYGNSLYVG